MGGIVRIELALGERRALAAETADFFERADLARQDRGGGAAQFVCGRAFGDVLGDDLVEAGFGPGAVDPGLNVHLRGQEADLLERLGAGGDCDGELLVAHQRVVEPRARQAAEDVQADLQGQRVGLVHAGAAPVAAEAQDGHLIGHLAPGGGGQGDRLGDDRPDLWPARDRAEPLFHQRARRGDVDVAGERQHRIVRAVVIAEPLADVLEAGGVEIGHRADRRVAIGVADREQAVADGIVGQAIGLVVVLPLLVLDDAALLIELVLGQRAEQVAHAVAFHEQRHVERALGHGLDVIGAIVPGRTIRRGRACRFQRLVEIGDVFRSAEEDVLIEVREAGLAARFVLRADAVIGRHADDGRLAIGVDQHGQAVG